MTTQFIPVPGHAWRTILDKATRHALDELTVELGVSLEDIQDAINGLETGAEDLDLTHDLLQSDIHLDTETNPPLPGALVVGSPAAADDLGLYWVDGLPIDLLNTTDTTGGVQFWVDGLPFVSVSSLVDGDVLWVRLPIGPDTYVLTSRGTSVEWAPVSAIFALASASASAAASQTLAAATATLIVLTTPEFDSGPFWSSAAPTRFTVPAGQGGTYRINGQLTWAFNTIGNLRARLLKNGALVARDEVGNLTGNITPGQAVEKLLVLAAADYIELEAYSDVGSLTVTAGTGETFLQIQRVL